MNEFVKGEFVRLEAKTTIHLGRLEMNLNPDVIEYDDDRPYGSDSKKLLCLS